MGIRVQNTVAATESLNISHKAGVMAVATANVPQQGLYISLVLRDGAPFDMALSASIEEALEVHQKFSDAIALMAEYEAAMAGGFTN